MECAYGKCRKAFHVTCAQSAGLHMELCEKGDRVEPKIFCVAHTAAGKSGAVAGKSGGRKPAKKRKRR